jgi:putative addiction module CopG family antidote
MEVKLKPETDLFVREQVHAGMYTSINEVIEHALDMLKQRELTEAERTAKFERLRMDIQVGIDQCNRGEFSPWSSDEIKAEGRRRLREKKQ